MHYHALYLENSWKRKCPQESGLFCCKCPSSPGTANVNARSTDAQSATWERWVRVGSGSRCSPQGTPQQLYECPGQREVPWPGLPGGGAALRPGKPTVHSPPGSDNSTLRPTARSPQGGTVDAKRGLVRWGLALRGWGQGSRGRPRRRDIPAWLSCREGAPAAPGQRRDRSAPRLGAPAPGPGSRGLHPEPLLCSAAGQLCPLPRRQRGQWPRHRDARRRLRAPSSRPCPRWAQRAVPESRAGAASKGGASRPSSLPPLPAPRAFPRPRRESVSAGGTAKKLTSLTAGIDH